MFIFRRQHSSWIVLNYTTSHSFTIWGNNFTSIQRTFSTQRCEIKLRAANVPLGLLNPASRNKKRMWKECVKHSLCFPCQLVAHLSCFILAWWVTLLSLVIDWRYVSAVETNAILIQRYRHFSGLRYFSYHHESSEYIPPTLTGVAAA